MKPEFKKCRYCQERDKDAMMYYTSKWESFICDKHKFLHEEKERMYANCNGCGVCARCKAEIEFLKDDHIDRVDYRPPNQMSINEEIEQERRQETLYEIQSSRRQFKKTSVMDKIPEKGVKGWR